MEVQPWCRGERLPQPEGLAEGSSADPGRLSDQREPSPRGVIRADESTAAGELFDLGESSGRMRAQWGRRTCPLLLDGDGIGQRVGVPPADGQGSEADPPQGIRGPCTTNQRSEARARRVLGKAES